MKNLNKIDLLKEFEETLYHNLLCYSENHLMNKPKEKFDNEWKETREKIGLLKEIMKDVQKNIQGEIWYSVRNENLDVLGSFNTLNEAIFFAEKKKKEYMRNYDNSKIWVEIDGETEEIYVAKGMKEKKRKNLSNI